VAIILHGGGANGSACRVSVPGGRGFYRAYSALCAILAAACLV
jgi:hypothetical protein